MVGDRKVTAWAVDCEELDLEFVSPRENETELRVDLLSKSERDELQAGIDATMVKLRNHMGRPVAVLGVVLPPRDWPLDE